VIPTSFSAAASNSISTGSKSTRRPFLVHVAQNSQLQQKRQQHHSVASAWTRLRGGAAADDDDSNNENDDINNSKPLENLQVMLRGTKYTISGVTTVQELMDRVQQESGNDKPHDVLFGGKRLQASDVLRAVGVADGAQLNMVPATTTTTTTTTSSSSSKTKSSSSTSSKASSSASSPASAAAAASVATASTSDSANAMQEYLQSAGVDPDKLQELMKSLGDGSGPGGAGMPDMGESLDMMTNMMNSPLFQEYMSNPEMLEQSRQMILSNPMLKNMMAAMPGMGDILQDADAWKEAMQAAANIYKNMDPETLKAMMKGMGGAGGMMPGMGMPGMSGMPPGLFDGTLDGSSSSSSPSSAATAAALDELDEDD
jgi:hypothetical protein